MIERPPETTCGDAYRVSVHRNERHQGAHVTMDHTPISDYICGAPAGHPVDLLDLAPANGTKETRHGQLVIESATRGTDYHNTRGNLTGYQRQGQLQVGRVLIGGVLLDDHVIGDLCVGDRVEVTNQDIHGITKRNRRVVATIDGHYEVRSREVFDDMGEWGISRCEDQDSFHLNDKIVLRAYWRVRVNPQVEVESTQIDGFTQSFHG